MRITGNEENSRENLTRRRILKASLLAAGAGFLALRKNSRRASAQVPLDCPSTPASLNLEMFQDPLPIPEVLAHYRGSNRGKLTYRLSADQFTHSFHSAMPPSQVWGFNGQIPGPTIEASRGRPIQLQVTNNLQSYLLCPDEQVHGAWPVPYLTVHGHGLLDRQDSDGFPEDRFPPGVTYSYEYPNIQEEATYWYHDHGLGVTRLSVMSGLAGFYIIRDRRDNEIFRFPKQYEIPLLVQDKSFNEDGSLWQAFPWAPEFFGDFATVNGKIWPYLDVKRGMYRFRILNGANSRFFNLNLNPPPPEGAFFQIGTDGGYLPYPVDLTDPMNTSMGGLLIAPAERADVIIDFSAYPAGTQVVMTNNAPAPFPGGGETQLPIVMAFNVGSGRGWKSSLPARLKSHRPSALPVQTRYLTLVDYGSPLPGFPPPPNPPAENGNLYPTLLLNNLPWIAPPTETPKAGSTEVWNIINLAPDTHPIHLHQTQFTILSRQPFDTLGYVAANPTLGPGVPVEPYLRGQPQPPYPHEAGLKDTVRANPGEVTTILVPFGPFKGRFVWHCHILDHEDNEMMRPLFLT